MSRGRHYSGRLCTPLPWGWDQPTACFPGGQSWNTRKTVISKRNTALAAPLGTPRAINAKPKIKAHPGGYKNLPGPCHTGCSRRKHESTFTSQLLPKPNYYSSPSSTHYSQELASARGLQHTLGDKMNTSVRSIYEFMLLCTPSQISPVWVVISISW